MANLIQKAKRKTPELTVIKWDGDGMSAYEIKSMLANHHVGVFYIGTDDWHHTLTSEEQQGLVYYHPYLVINAGRREVRLEKDQYLVLNPEASNLEPKVTIMSEEELRKTHELYETKKEGEDNVLDEQDPPEAGPILHEPVPEESPEESPIIFEPVPQPEEEVVDDNPSDDDQAEGSEYRAVEDLVGHGDGELRERDSLGGESGEPTHEDEPNV